MFIGIDELVNFGLEVYPNPVVDFITVSSKKDMIVSTKVIDAAGKTIAIGSVNNFESVIDFRKLAKGAYTIVHLLSNNNIKHLSWKGERLLSFFLLVIVLVHKAYLLLVYLIN